VKLNPQKTSLKRQRKHLNPPTEGGIENAEQKSFRVVALQSYRWMRRGFLAATQYCRRPASKCQLNVGINPVFHDGSNQQRDGRHNHQS
jgi:hypothetical protein